MPPAPAPAPSSAIGSSGFPALSFGAAGAAPPSTPFSFKPQALSFGTPAAASSAAAAPAAAAGDDDEDAMPLLEPEKAQKQKDPNEVFEKDPIKVFRLDKVRSSVCSRVCPRCACV